ncbi:GGDEF domain-containing protein [Caballeronia sordidicola]|uniref:GGDEF domain-containing protein n=1 Tax=Caballeronia sordidicola TaxID=196367 RepID=UPI0004D00A94|nr:GGDEF domain-containing protein [Caballeronia sordidicola]
MAPKASEISTPIRERQRACKPALPMRSGPGPATIAFVSFLCLLIGLLFLALQIRTIFSDQLKQEYSGLVLEGIERTESARNLVRVWQRQSDNNIARSGQPEQPEPSDDYRRARNDLAARLASLAALVNASPSAAPRIPQSALSPDANLDDTDALLAVESVYWRAQRNNDSADARTRIARVASMLIVLSACVFGALITALGMYAKRTRQLAGESHKFEHAALHDAMTGLPNRRKLFATLAETAARSSGNPTPQKIAVIYIDLDGFKQVNDSLGHRIGDEFLVAVSKRFRKTVRLVDVVARFGGDEFVVLVREFSTTAELEAIAQRLIDCVLQTDEQMGIGFVSASIGIASFPNPVRDFHQLVTAADETMYQVKRNGKNGYAFATQVS